MSKEIVYGPRGLLQKANLAKMFLDNWYKIRFDYFGPYAVCRECNTIYFAKLESYPKNILFVKIIVNGKQINKCPHCTFEKTGEIIW